MDRPRSRPGPDGARIAPSEPRIERARALVTSDDSEPRLSISRTADFVLCLAKENRRHTGSTGRPVDVESAPPHRPSRRRIPGSGRGTRPPTCFRLVLARGIRTAPRCDRGRAPAGRARHDRQPILSSRSARLRRCHWKLPCGPGKVRQMWPRATALTCLTIPEYPSRSAPLSDQRGSGLTGLGFGGCPGIARRIVRVDVSRSATDDRHDCRRVDDQGGSDGSRGRLRRAKMGVTPARRRHRSGRRLCSQHSGRAQYVQDAESNGARVSTTRPSRIARPGGARAKHTGSSLPTSSRKYSSLRSPAKTSLSTLAAGYGRCANSNREGCSMAPDRASFRRRRANLSPILIRYRQCAACSC